MKQAVTGTAVVVLLVAGAWLLMTATKTVPSTPPPGSRSTVTVELAGTAGPSTLAQAAEALLRTCLADVPSDLTDGPDDLGRRRFRAVVSPALGDDETRKVRGCLVDLRLDSVLGRSVEITDEGTG